jgi:hypothetical protein
MSKTKNRVKLPKRLLGVKIPKATRKLVRAQFKDLPSDKAEPLIAAAVGTLVAILTAKVEQQPQPEVAEGGAKKVKRKVAAVTAVPAVH